MRVIVQGWQAVLIIALIFFNIGYFSGYYQAKKNMKAIMKTMEDSK